MRNIIAWFAQNHIAANLLMVLIFTAGGIAIHDIRKEFIPAFSLESVVISVPYPGAAPAEVEQAICLRVEEAIDGLDGIKRLTASAASGVGSITAEIHPDYDADQLLSEIKTRVDAITSFPADVERPIITKPSIRSPVIQVILSGPMDEHNLRSQAEMIRNEIAYLPDISQVELSSTRPYEISIEISDYALQRYNLQFEDIARAIRTTSFDLPGGSIKSRSSDILLRIRDQAYSGAEFADIIVSSSPESGDIRLRDIARIDDGFQENDVSIRFDREPAISMLVYRIGDQDILQIAETVRHYVGEKNHDLPPGVSLHVWRDESRLYQDRLDTLSSNALGGLLLVFLVLMLFLGLKLAFWVALGIPISFLGALAVMHAQDESLNMISMFAFLLVIGIVVDDAIVVGESVHRSQQGSDEDSMVDRTIGGTWRVGKPVFFAVTTTIVAFAPMLFLPGVDGKFWRIIPVVVISCLAFSLIESLYILPAHLAHRSRIAVFLSWWTRPLHGVLGWIKARACALQQGFSNKVDQFVENWYLPVLRATVSWRYATFALFVMLFLILVGMFAGDRIQMVFFPRIEGDTITVHLEMPIGTNIRETATVTEYILDAGNELQRQLRKEQGAEVITHFYVMTGAQASMGRGPDHGGSNSTSTHLAQIIAEVDEDMNKIIPTRDISQRWRTLCGTIPGVQSLTFQSQFMSDNVDIQVQLIGPSLEELKTVSAKLAEKLNNFTGVHDITNNFPFGKDEIRLSLTEEGRALGVDQLSLARQIQSAFFGNEAQRVQRSRDEVRVYIRYPRSQRSSLADLMQMYIAHNGERLPLHRIAHIEYGTSYATISRQDRRRVVMLTAKIDHSKQNADLVDKEFINFFNDEIKKQHPQVNIKKAGKQEDRGELMESLRSGMIISMIAIYALIAIAFHSYLQPVVIMAAIPFGLIGAIGGHFILSMPVSMLSILGIVALTGVVVNDSLVLVDSINRHRQGGMETLSAITAGAQSRFRAIILTTLTTFFGLIPVMLETSVQSQFLIPMAASLAFGVLFATVITLILVPALTGIVHDLHERLGVAEGY